MTRLNRYLIGTVILLSGLLLLAGARALRPTPEAPAPRMAATALPPLAVHFAPGDECEAEAVKQLGAAKTTVRVLAYNFSAEPIKLALVAAHKRKVDVRCIVDHVAASERGCMIPDLRAAGIRCWIDKKHKIAHSKVLIIDGGTVVTGSYNWSKNAKSNSENMLTIRSASLATTYADVWDEHCKHSDEVK